MRTREEEAADAVLLAERELKSVENELSTLSSTQDVAEWHRQRALIDQGLTSASKVLDRARKLDAPAVPLAALEQRMGKLVQSAASASEPASYSAVSSESELLAALSAKPEGGATVGNQRKEAAIAALFEQLSLTDSKTLAGRLKKRAPGDPIATAFGRLIQERQARLLETLSGAPRRKAMLEEAMKRAATQRSVAAPSASEAVETSMEMPQPADILRLGPEEAVEGSAPAAKTDGVDRQTSTKATVEYLRLNSIHAWDAITSYLASMAWSAPTDRITLTEPVFVHAIVAALKAEAEDFVPEKLDAAMFPHDIYAEVEGYRPSNAIEWAPAIGLRLGQLFHQTISASYRRMALRFVDAADARATEAATRLLTITPAELVTSRPMDRYVASGLTARVDPYRQVAHVVPDGSRPRPRTALRPVNLTWEGSRDPSLWNWVRADLADASAEEVAASLFSYARGQFGGDSTSFFAYGLAAAPPLFALPVRWALQFPDARLHAPAPLLLGKLPEVGVDTQEGRLAALAATGAGDGIAIQQAAGAQDPRAVGLDGPGVAEVVGHSVLQLSQLKSTLTAWDLSAELIPAVIHAASKQTSIATAAPDQVAAWAPIAIGQRDRLFRIAAGVKQLTGSASGMGAQRDASHPLRKLLSLYASAAATSHFAATSEALIAQAQGAQAGLSLRALQANIVDLEAAMDAAHPGGRPGDKATRNQASPYGTTMDEARLLENKLLNGAQVDANELERVQINAQEISINLRMHGLQVQVRELQESAEEARRGPAARFASLFSGRFRELGDVAAFIHQALGEIQVDLYADYRAEVARPRSGDADGLNPLPPEVLAKKLAVKRAQERFEELRVDKDLGHFVNEGAKLVESQRFRTACVQAAVMVGITIASSAAAGWVAESMGARYLTTKAVETVAELSVGAQRAIRVGAFMTETMGNTVGQQLTTGDSFLKSFADNALFTLGSEATLGVIARDVDAGRQFHKLLDTQVKAIESVEARLASKASKLSKVARWSAHQSLELTGHTITRMAMGALVQKLEETVGKAVPTDADSARNATSATKHHGASSDQMQEFLIQGASIAIGRLTHARLGERMPGLQRLAKSRESARAERLYADAQQLNELAASVTKSGNAMEALEVLDRQRQLLIEEIAVLDEIAARHGNTPHPELGDIAQGRAELQGQLGNVSDGAMLAVRFHLVGMRELAPGTLWSGTHEEVQRAAREARRSAPGAKVVEDAVTGSITIHLDGQTIELHESAGPRKAPARAAEHATSRPPDAAHELSSAVTMVPGSELRADATPSKEHATAVLARANATLESLHGIESVTGVTRHGNSFLVTHGAGEVTSIEIVIAKVDGSDVARLVPNSSRRAKGPGTAVIGEHVIQLSDKLPVDQVERTVAHAVARLIAAHEAANKGHYPHEGAKLGADDRGRAAEIGVLARQAQNDPAHAARARREMIALVEYLGLREGTPGAAEHLADIEGQLDATGRMELERARRMPREDDAASRAELDHVRAAAERDLAAEHAEHTRKSIDRDAPTSMADHPGQRISRPQLKEYASVAERLRWLVSERTIAKYRAQARALPAGQYPKSNKVQRGGGAALAARQPDALLVDLRGRWQADGSADIAQTGQQLHQLYKAKFGDVREVAAPNERVPLEAIRYWEDSLAAQGEVIDGHGTYRIDDHGRLLMDIVPTDGSGKLTIEIGDSAVSATGFPSPEILPGAPRNMSVYEVILSVETQLQTLATTSPDAKVKAAATTALGKLRDIHSTQDADMARVKSALESEGNILEAALRPGHADPVTQRTVLPANGALDALDAHAAWSKLVGQDASDGQQQMFFGKDTNLASIKAAATPNGPKTDTVAKHWVFAGSGGTSVSGAEIILRSTNKAEVTLAGRDTPAGLFANTQFRQLAEAHGDADVFAAAASAGVKLAQGKSDGRLHVKLNRSYDFAAPEIHTGPDGAQTFELKTRTSSPDTRPATSDSVATGDMFVSSLGSAGQLPPDIAELALAARRQSPDLVNHEHVFLRPVTVHANFRDRRYTGYTVTIRMNGAERAFQVTGAASRYVPEGEFIRMPNGEKDLAAIKAAAADEAHDKSGSFAGGFGPTTLQGRHQPIPATRKGDK